MNSEQETSHSQAWQSSGFISRRDFIQFGVAALGAAWAGTWIQSRLFPASTGSAEAQPVRFPLADLPVGSAKAVNYGGVPVMVLRTPESLRAFSLVCTHLGCIVQWQAADGEFYCACHDGTFDQFGEVISGPPQLPLEQISVKIDGQEVIVGEVA